MCDASGPGFAVTIACSGSTADGVGGRGGRRRCKRGATYPEQVIRADDETTL